MHFGRVRSLANAFADSQDTCNRFIFKQEKIDYYLLIKILK